MKHVMIIFVVTIFFISCVPEYKRPWVGTIVDKTYTLNFIGEPKCIIIIKESSGKIYETSTGIGKYYESKIGECVNVFSNAFVSWIAD